MVARVKLVQALPMHKDPTYSDGSICAGHRSNNMLLRCKLGVGFAIMAVAYASAAYPLVSLPMPAGVGGSCSGLALASAGRQSGLWGAE